MYSTDELVCTHAGIHGWRESGGAVSAFDGGTSGHGIQNDGMCNDNSGSSNVTISESTAVTKEYWMALMTWDCMHITSQVHV